MLTGAVCLWGCNGTGTSADSSDLTLDGEFISVAESSPVMQRIEIQPVTATSYSARFTTSGTVRAIPSAYAQIALPFAGRIVRSFVQLGRQVGKDTPLFEYISPDYAEICRSYLDAVREYEQAEKVLARAEDLQEHRVGAVKDTEEARLDLELKRHTRENAEAALRAFNVDPADVRSGEPLVVRSPIAGKIVADRIVIGQYLREDADPQIVVADLNKVWVVANVKEKDMRLIERLQEVAISLASEPDRPVRGRICHIGDLLDEQTRAVEVIIECDNADGRMKPNMYALVELTDRPVEAIVIPTSAVLQQEGSCYVLVADGERRFRKTPVEIVATEADRSVIGNGLAVGDEIVVRGAFYLLDAK